MTFTLYATFTALPEHRWDVADLLARFTQTARAESGCLLFEPATRADRPTEFVVYEIYRDESAFRAHVDSAEFRTFHEALAPLIQQEGPEPHFLDPIPMDSMS